MSDEFERAPEAQPGIPHVSAETLKALKSQYTDNSGDNQTWGERLTKTQEELIATNPHMVEFIEMQIGKFPKELHQPMFEVIIGTLVLVERQTQADALNASFPDIAPGQ